MKKVNLLAIAACLLFTLSCDQDAENRLAPEADKYDAQRYVELAEALLAEGAEEIEFRGNAAVTVSAPSVDAIEDAINQAGPGGTVILEAGLHTVSSTVTIEHKVKLTGQPGAVLEADSGLDGYWPYQSDPALHVLNAHQVVIENLTIRDADGSGNIGILLENASNARIRYNTIKDFQIGLAPHQSDHLRVHDNNFVGNPADIPVITYGILYLSGKNAKIYENSFVDFNAQVFLGSRGGLFKSNYLSGGFIGLLFCTPPIGNSVVLPSGEVVGADESGNEWLALDNLSENTVWGYLAIDNGNNNTMVNNDANNNVIDIEMAGETSRFGVPMPTSFGNFAISSAYPNVTIKVCGENNEAVGGAQIDTSQFPCD